jgi:predicted murein hydrolase (TIGR00659 family)
VTSELFSLWVYLSATPLLGLTVTLVAFQISLWLNRMAGGSPVLHPVILSMVFLIALLWLTDTSYQTYFEGAQFVHFLLGPATVALAIPLYDNLELIKRMLGPILITSVTGAAAAAASAVAVILLMGGQRQTLLSIAPKSVTSPVAMGIAEQLGGIPSLTAGMVLITGAFGCMIAPLLFRLLRIHDDSVKGFALGLAAHGFGTAQAFGISATAGAFAGLALGLMAIVTAFLLPWAMSVLGLLS